MKYSFFLAFACAMFGVIGMAAMAGDGAAPIGEPQLMRFALLPTAWRFAAGSRIRLSIAGGDADHFVQTPHGRPPLLTVMSGADKATRLELPTDG